MRVYFSYQARQNPCLSFGKSGRYIRRLLETMADVVPEKEAESADLQIYLGCPFARWKHLFRRRAPKRVLFLMWESLNLPAAHIREPNRSEGLMTPCRWCDDLYRKRGVTTPRFIVPIGYDPAAHPFINRPPDRPFTFLWMGINAGHIHKIRREKAKATGDRKRGFLVREAFRQLALPDSRLIIKDIPYPNGILDMTYSIGKNARIRELSAWLTEPEMRQLAFESDIFVWPTWGEGWGMPPVEMAGTGMPSVLPNYSGIEAYFNPAWCLDLPYTVGPIHKGSHSVGANITLEDLKDKMRWAYDHREDVRAMGKVAAQDVSEHRTWEKATRPALRKVLEYYG